MIWYHFQHENGLGHHSQVPLMLHFLVEEVLKLHMKITLTSLNIKHCFNTKLCLNSITDIIWEFQHLTASLKLCKIIMLLLLPFKTQDNLNNEDIKYVNCIINTSRILTSPNFHWKGKTILLGELQQWQISVLSPF
jgi:hypothetical protein